MPIRRLPAVASTVLQLLIWGWMSIAVAQQREPMDRILAVVDDDPILASEVQQVIAFGLVQPQQGETDQSLQRRTLDFLIEQKLRFHEVDRFGFAEVPIEAVDEEYEKVRARFESPEEFQRRLDELGLDEQGARQLFARQLMVWVYVEERLGARVFVGLEDVRNYYEESLVPELVERGEPVPALQSVREPIRTLLREQRMNEELEHWTLELRQAADIEDFFESRYSSLPPVVHLIEADID